MQRTGQYRRLPLRSRRYSVSLALSPELSGAATVRWPERVACFGDKRLRGFDLAVADRLQLGNFNDPSGDELQRCVLAVNVGKIAGEPFWPLRECARAACFANSLRAFQNQCVISLAARLDDPGDRRYEKPRANGGEIVRRCGRVEVFREPDVQALRAPRDFVYAAALKGVQPATFSTAARRLSGARCEYFSVIANSLWPRSSCTV